MTNAEKAARLLVEDNNRRVIGPPSDDYGFPAWALGAGVRHSNRQAVINGDVIVPEWIEIKAEPIDGAPGFECRMEVIEGRVTFSEMRILGAFEGKRTALELVDFFSRVAMRVSVNDEFTSTQGERFVGADRYELSKDIDIQRKHGPKARRRTQELIERAAEIYRESFDNGRPTATVAEALGVSHSSAAQYIARARKDGLLPPAAQGQAKR